MEKSLSIQQIRTSITTMRERSAGWNVSDLTKIGKIATRKNLKFVDQFKALNHYRKHGEEFTELGTLKFYMDYLPSDILRNRRLAEVCDITSINTVSMFEAARNC
ncbi:hypothetical protein Aduo_016174 [Ancylostoma duodenale]